MAGLGMFLLARSWGLGSWGRWFAGLVYPFCGFLVALAAVPGDRRRDLDAMAVSGDRRRVSSTRGQGGGWLAVVVALVIFGGHIQTSAHVLLAGGLYALALGSGRADVVRTRRATISWVLGTCLGLGLAAAQILPLAFYLAKSSVWSDRQSERPPWWVIDRPRILDMVCTAIPYAYGSQRRGHPNLARALGVHNLNESAGGYAGLATLIWLAPLAVTARGRTLRVAFLTGLVIFGAWGHSAGRQSTTCCAALPVLDVTDNRRLTLWVAFGLTLLGGIGLDQLGQSQRLARGWLAAWLLGALFLGSLACAIPSFERPLRERAGAHYRQAASSTPGADVTAYQERADRQVRQLVHYLPRYYALVAVELGVLTALLARQRRSRCCRSWIQPALIWADAVRPGRAGFRPQSGDCCRAFTRSSRR